jgi:hypothetical protein
LIGEIVASGRSTEPEAASVARRDLHGGCDSRLITTIMQIWRQPANSTDFGRLSLAAT